MRGQSTGSRRHFARLQRDVRLAISLLEFNCDIAPLLDIEFDDYDNDLILLRYLLERRNRYPD